MSDKIVSQGTWPVKFSCNVFTLAEDQAQVKSDLYCHPARVRHLAMTVWQNHTFPEAITNITPSLQVHPAYLEGLHVLTSWTISVSLKITGKVQWYIKHHCFHRIEGLRFKFLWQRLQQNWRLTLHCVLSKNQSSVRFCKLWPKSWAIWLSDARQMNFLRATQQHSFSFLSAAFETQAAAQQG